MRLERLLQKQRRSREAKEKDPNLPGSRLSSEPRLAATYASPIIAIQLIIPDCTESPLNRRLTRQMFDAIRSELVASFPDGVPAYPVFTCGRI